MSIALIILSLRAGGAERVLVRLAHYWLKKGHKVFFITFVPKEEIPFYPLDPNICYVPLGFWKNPHFFLKILHVIVCLWKLRSFFKVTKPQLAVSFLTTANLITLLASRGLKIPTVVSERIHPAYHPLGRIISWLRLKLYPWCRFLVVQTVSAGTYFPVSFQSFLKVIPNPVPLCSSPHKPQDSLKNLLSVGRLTPQKDHETLLKAFGLVAQEAPQAHLTLYGEGPLRPFLENQIKILDLDGRVSLPGIHPHLVSVLKTFDLFVFPSLYEGFPNALAEAMAHGLPVIASMCSGNRDIVKDGVNGLLFPVGDTEILAEKMRILLNNTALRQKLSQNAPHISLDYSPEKIYALWDGLLKEIF